MQKRRMTLFVTLLLVALMVIAGCGPRAGGGSRAASAGPGDIVVDLPAIYIDFDADGVANVGGMSVSQAAAMIGQSIPDLSIDPAVVKSLTDYNIQHVQLINSPTGLDILVNGLRVPSLAWDGEVLNNLKELLASVGADLGSAGNMLPLIGTFGTGIVLRFPVAADAEAIPLVNPVGEENAARAAQAAASFAASVGESAPTIQFAVDYAPDGTWTVDNKGAAEWEQVLPIGWDGFDLDPETIAAAAAAGVKTFGLSTDEAGINIAVNDKALPTITWANGEISNILTLLEDSGLLGSLTDDNPQMAGMLDLVEGLLPTIQTADFSMVVNFPAP